MRTSYGPESDVRPRSSTSRSSAVASMLHIGGTMPQRIEMYVNWVGAHPVQQYPRRSRACVANSPGWGGAQSRQWKGTTEHPCLYSAWRAQQIQPEHLKWHGPRLARPVMASRVFLPLLNLTSYSSPDLDPHTQLPKA